MVSEGMDASADRVGPRPYAAFVGAEEFSEIYIGRGLSGLEL